MTPLDFRFLLLTSKLGDPERKSLTSAQLGFLTQRSQLLSAIHEERDLTEQDLWNLGIDKALSSRIIKLLEDVLQLNAYLSAAKKANCEAITRTNHGYPLLLRKRLGTEAPGCLWIKGDPEILKFRSVALVGSRNLSEENYQFARDVGIQAALQGYVLVSGNARGADQAAQNACLAAGGCVISVIADSLAEHTAKKNMLYISEEDFDEPFSAQRALHRNQIIHALGEITFVAQCELEKGGTWSGSTQNLKKHLSPLYCFQDYTPASFALEGKGAVLIQREALKSFSTLFDNQLSIF